MENSAKSLFLRSIKAHAFSLVFSNYVILLTHFCDFIAELAAYLIIHKFNAYFLNILYKRQKFSLIEMSVLSYLNNS